MVSYGSDPKEAYPLWANVMPFDFALPYLKGKRYNFYILKASKKHSNALTLRIIMHHSKIVKNTLTTF